MGISNFTEDLGKTAWKGAELQQMKTHATHCIGLKLNSHPMKGTTVTYPVAGGLIKISSNKTAKTYYFLPRHFLSFVFIPSPELIFNNKVSDTKIVNQILLNSIYILNLHNMLGKGQLILQFQVSVLTMQKPARSPRMRFFNGNCTTGSNHCTCDTGQGSSISARELDTHSTQQGWDQAARA